MSTRCFQEGVSEMSLVQKEKQVPVIEHQKLSSIIRGLIGKFKVGKFYLYNKSNDSFCILGALGFAGGMTRYEIGRANYVGIWKLYPELQDEVCIDRNLGRLEYKLFTMNDHGDSWSSIADKLEEIGY